LLRAQDLIFNAVEVQPKDAPVNQSLAAVDGKALNYGNIDLRAQPVVSHMVE